MGFLTSEELSSNSLQYVSINKDTGHFEIKQNNEINSYPGLKGWLLGFGREKSTYKSGKFEGKPVDTFLIYLKDNGSIYQVKMGFYTYRALFTMNFFRSLDKIEQKEVKLVASDNSTLIQYNNVRLKYKIKYADLKLPDDAAKKKAKKNGIIDKWFEDLYTKMPYEVAPPTITKEEINEDESDDVPF